MPENTTPTNDLDFKAEVPIIALGTPVEYVGTQGKVKLAIVVGTPESVEEGTELPALLPGQLHLGVWTWSVGTFTPRLNVPFEALVSDNAEFQQGGKSVGVWRVAS